MNGLETPMVIRRTRYQLETIFDHQLAFLKKFAPALVKAHPDVTALATSIASEFVPHTPQAVKSTTEPVSAPSTAKSARDIPPTAKCACGYFFIVQDKCKDCQEHLDNCEGFKRMAPGEKASLLLNLGLDTKALKAPKNQTQPRAENVTCRHCKREFASAQSQWFYQVHLKVSYIPPERFTAPR
jgi:hypothetical protein